ncbi:PSD1 and planctomycete cytochrome C domain-containing protein [Gemmata sp. JC717]|uniref:PSD1 and planctomycete cytochrome C domain-containing protein n=1 Tax=Gemmata algarum TaxID=2975278 RepID=UPI0021BB8477|nr:PSD1 and planctomycete cytochrome C domain-containing protein [Gemmata algarum]MDY3551736.1 PSD1 and planctomycete cytochrome C domain-containing protein [Gemmata algarum]
MRTAALVAAALLAPVARAAEPVDNEFFEKKVRPVLVAHCISCHDAKKQKGGLRLDTKGEFAKGGDNGAAVKPGDPAKSLLIEAVAYGGDIKMPPKGKLSDADIATLTAWVKGGAPWPADGGNAQGPTEKFDPHARAKAQWSFRPIQRPPVPDIQGSKAEVRNDIDRFLLARLQKEGLSFAPPAEKRALLRRVTFDLIGLPPTPEEVNAFLKDDGPGAFEKVVDRLLASPQYGVRWARHWLDLVRYAETQGHEFDFDIPDAWRYRDYVVRALNADVPYDTFLTEHVAGDLLPPRFSKDGLNDALIATGFWWLGEAKHSPVDSRAEYADRVDNQIDVFGKTVLGLTIGCARCHDHKFDPISTKDYYALFGVLSSSRYNRADVSDPASTVKLLDELKAVRAKLARDNTPPGAPNPQPAAGWREKSPAFEEFGAGWRDRWFADGLAFRPEGGDGFPHSGRETQKLMGALRSPTFTIDKPFLAIRVAGRNARARVILNGLQLIQNPIYGGLAHGIGHGEELHWMTFDLGMWKGQPAYLELLDDGPGFVAISEARFADTPPPAEGGTKVYLPAAPVDGGDEAKRLAARANEIEAQLPAPRRAPTMRDGNGINERVFIRGSHKSPGAEAPRGPLEAFALPAFKSAGSGRLELARTLTDPSNPLVTRVLVNRLWKHHFGEGLVRSPDDFGAQGQPPTHPELLDWLAAELVAKKWSLKAVHKLMLLSAAYQQSSRAVPEQTAKALTADPQNKLLHRQNVKRLEAEAIRDGILAVSGRLDLRTDGPGVLPHLTEHQVGRGRPASGPLDGDGRRSLYLQVRRNFLNPMFTAFDYPTPFTAIGRRTVSNVPAQALVMLNNPFVLQQTELWAKRVLAQPGAKPEDRVRAMYAAAFGREPSNDELGAATAFVAEQSNEYGKPNHPKAWADLAHVLVNAKEFVFVE